MSDQLGQMQLVYSAEQDRLLLRLNTTSGRSEFHFWLTRYFVRLLWPTLVKSLSSHPDISRLTDPLAKSALMDFQHQSAMENSDLSQPFREGGAERPLGKAPILVTQGSISKTAVGGFQLTLLPGKGPGLKVDLTVALLHGLCKLLQDAAKRADWGLDLTLRLTESKRVPGVPRITLPVTGPDKKMVH